jgi:hypothetical protein
MFYFIIAQCKCNLYCQHTNVEIKYLSRVEIKLSHTASGGQSNLETHQISCLVYNQVPVVYLMTAEDLSLSMDA